MTIENNGKVEKCNICGGINKSYDSINKIYKCTSCGHYYVRNRNNLNDKKEKKTAELCTCEKFKKAVEEEYIEHPFVSDTSFYITKCEHDRQCGDSETFYKQIKFCPFCGKLIGNNKEIIKGKVIPQQKKVLPLKYKLNHI